MVTPALADGTEVWNEVDASNKSKIATYIGNKSCVDVGKTFVKHGWQKYRNPKNLPYELESKTHPNYKLFSKHKELSECNGSGIGECFGTFKKDKVFVTVRYLAEGGGGFESKHCGVDSYAITSAPIYPYSPD
jgi:hypothetical protein